MNQFRSLISAVFVCALFACTSIAAFGQGEPRAMVEPSFEVSLQLVIGSNEAGRASDLPANLSNVTRQIKAAFPFSNYRMASTFVGRIANTGTFEYKSITNVLGESDARSGAFLEWSMNSFRNLPTAAGRQGFQAQGFRFGARVPVTTGTYKDESGKISPVINYESIGLTLNKIGLPENQPTLVGTLNLPGANGTVFLLMTVKSADM